MNKIQVGGFIRISKREAERRYNAGETVRFCTCKLSPVNMWGCFCDCKREAFSPIAGDGFNTVVPRNREFETVVRRTEQRYFVGMLSADYGCSCTRFNR